MKCPSFSTGDLFFRVSRFAANNFLGRKVDVMKEAVLVILLFVHASSADPRVQTIQMTCGNSQMQNGSVYGSNFVATMEKISFQIQASSFGTAVTGTGVDISYGLAQCYGDLSSVDCVLCYAEMRTRLPLCYPKNSGRIFLDGCFMRAENYSFYQEYAGPNDHVVCGNTTRKDSAFQASTKQALSQAVSAAPGNNGYARMQVTVPGTANESTYVLANCWRTINANACTTCLENATSSLTQCLPWSEGKALNTGCFMRYSNTNFLNPIPKKGSSRGRTTIIIIVVVSATAVLIVGGLIGVYLWKHRVIQRKRKGSGAMEKLVKSLKNSGLNFKYQTLEKATGSFDEANKLGQGGFGTVYKGVLPDGREIAVKRLFFNNKHRAEDFYNEIKLISSIQHKNLVRLLGCSCSGPESLLVYEFLPNKSLDHFIFDANKGKALTWERRFSIIIGTAKGLVYLHENTRSRILHRDIKASNILLDSKHDAKIGDFGLARSFQENKSHISTAIAGTLGYMAPEYIAHGRLTEKADVYSFGILVLEIVCGQMNNRSNSTECGGDSLLTSAWKHFQQSKVEEIMDPNLMLNKHENINMKDEIVRVVHVGLLCTQERSGLRPSMSGALEMLEKKEEELPAPSKPPFLDDKTMELNGMMGSAEEDGNHASIATISIYESMFYPSPLIRRKGRRTFKL